MCKSGKRERILSLSRFLFFNFALIKSSAIRLPVLKLRISDKIEIADIAGNKESVRIVKGQPFGADVKIVT